MNFRLNDLIEAFPEDDGQGQDHAPVSQQEFQAILSDLAHRAPPVGSLERAWTVGGLYTQIAIAYGGLWMRHWFADAETSERQTMETNLRVAMKTFHRMGYLRGAMTKLGQTIGNLPDILPDQIVETLDRLHSEAPPMHFSLLREMVRNELGADPDELFESFDNEAFAAASLGQVHRARLKSGERVAVKIQYPGIARTIDADFRNLNALLFPMRLSSDWQAVQAQFEEVRRMLKLETDYEHEARSLDEARRLFEPEEGIVVPRFYPEFSTHRVLTMDYLPGPHLDEFLVGNPPQELRNHFGTKLYTVWCRMYYAYMGYADPHSGNYVLMDDGRLGLLDFGCVQHYDAMARELVDLTDRLLDDPNALPEMLRRSCTLKPDDAEREDFIRLSEDGLNWTLEPMGPDQPFDFADPAHFRRGIEWYMAGVRGRFVGGHPMLIYLYRSIFGLKAMLLKLKARVDVPEVFRHERRIWRMRQSS